MNGQKRDLPLVLLTASAGLISALAAICLNFPIGRYAPLLSNRLGFGFIFLPGTVFGLVVWSCLAFRRYLHDPWKAIVISDIFGLSYYLFIWIAFTVELCSPFGRPGDEDALISKSALFAGGLAGTFMALGAVSVPMNSGIAWEHRMLTVLYGSLVGGILGVLGWTLGPFLGMALWLVICMVTARMKLCPNHVCRRKIDAHESKTHLGLALVLSGGRAPRSSWTGRRWQISRGETWLCP